MGKVTEITDTPSTPSRKTQLDDVASAFYFSRLPREERIAQILYYILMDYVCIHRDGGRLDPTKPLGLENITEPEGLKEIATELAKYSVKDFAVRYGKL